MIKISDTIQSILSSSPFLSFGFHERLFNLSSLARYLQKPIETYLQKEVQISAIKMNLSRLQKEMDKIIYNPEIFMVNNISVQNNLATITYPLTPKVERKIQAMESDITGNSESFIITQSTSEITICCNKTIIPMIQDKLKHTDYKYANTTLSALRVQFTETTANESGMIYFLLQKLVSQGVNIVEISSTYTECVLFVNTVDIKKSFNIIHDSFIQA